MGVVVVVILVFGDAGFQSGLRAEVLRPTYADAVDVRARAAIFRKIFCSSARSRHKFL